MKMRDCDDHLPYAYMYIVVQGKDLASCAEIQVQLPDGVSGQIFSFFF